MNITARRISGNTFSADDKLEVVFDSENQTMASVIHTIESVSGPEVTHGGGALPNEYLHYKSIDIDADADGNIDYSNVIMEVVQSSKGTSKVKVVCEVIKKADIDIFNIAIAGYRERVLHALSIGETYSETSPILTKSVLKTGEITLEWGDDSFV